MREATWLMLHCAVAELLADNNRLNLVPKIAETFEEIIASARGQIKAVVTTAEVCKPLLRRSVVCYALHTRTRLFLQCIMCQLQCVIFHCAEA